MDDTRIEWMRNKIYLGLGITDPEVFDDLLSREDGQFENEMLKFLNETPKEACTMIFYSMLKEEEEEIEVEAGELLQITRFVWAPYSLLRSNNKSALLLSTISSLLRLFT